MVRTLGKILIVVAVTTIGAKIVKRNCPGFPGEVAGKTLKALNVLKEGAKGFVSAAGDAFKDGYASARQHV